MEKIRIKFKQSRTREEYWSQTLHLTNGKTTLVHPKVADKLIEHFPNNFEKIIVRPRNIGKQLRLKLKLNQISLISIVNKPEIFKRNLGTCIPKKIEFIRLNNENNKNWVSASKALNYGIRKAKNAIVVLAHQDIKFHKSWWQNFIKQECRLQNWGALGGVGIIGNRYRLVWGYSLDRAIRASSLDECLIAINKRNDIWFDSGVLDGWHLYSADYCLQCKKKGLGVFILAGEFAHNWQQNPKSNWLKSTIPYRQKLSQKWGNQDIVTTIGKI